MTDKSRGAATVEQIYFGRDRGWDYAHHRRCPGIPTADPDVTQYG